MKIVRATFHLTDADRAALTGAEPKLSRVPPAHWRNVYQYSMPPSAQTRATWIAEGAVELSPGIWMAGKRHVSAELAEQRGVEFAAGENRAHGFRLIAYLRAEKFEGEGP